MVICLAIGLTHPTNCLVWKARAQVWQPTGATSMTHNPYESPRTESDAEVSRPQVSIRWLVTPFLTLVVIGLLAPSCSR